MEQNKEETVFESETSDRTVSDLFSGSLSLEQALQKLRTRLLDLSSRNRLISYRYPKGRSIQFIEKPNLNLVFNRLIDNKSLLIKLVPDPPPSSYTLRRPDVKTYAQSLGLDTEFDFPPASCGDYANKHTPRLQALYYPADLDRLCRKIASEARTVIEETGTNMLHLIFGFLEFYDSEDSEKPTLAPLLAVPVTLEKGAIDSDTRTYQYSINYSGEDVHENQTLREKLSQDFVLQLPLFNDEEELGAYFLQIQQAVKNKKRWRVRYQLTLGFLSFGKLAIWEDLDPKKWPRLLSHPLLNEIFSGGSGKGASSSAQDYEIDKHPQADLPLIYDADSSQHSAIIDVLSGKNMVINGPPGTGKSQTITNIIAAGLKEGKKILFVSEKLAALEVVRHRLNHANLGHFCLELHSHKTQKKKLLGDLQDRLDAQFYPPQQLQNKITTLKRLKNELNRYTELISSRFGNELGLSVYEIFWKTERYRQSIGDLANAVQSLFLPESSNYSYDDIQCNRAKLEVLGQLFDIIGGYDSTHPWWGFTPQPLAPGDDETVGQIISEAFVLAEELFESVIAFQDRTNYSEEPNLATLEVLNSTLKTLLIPPLNIVGELLPRVFSLQDPMGKRNKELLRHIISKIEQARELDARAEALLIPGCELSYDAAEPIVESCSKELDASAFTVPLDNLEESVFVAKQTLRRFKEILAESVYAFLPIQYTTLESLNGKLDGICPLILADQPIQRICEGASLLSLEVTRLRQSFERVSSIANRRDIAFDGSPAAISSLSHPDGIDDVLPGVLVDDAVIAKAQYASEYFLSELPISELNFRYQELNKLHDRINLAVSEIRGYAQQLGFAFDSSRNSVIFLVTLSKISSKAPADLLDFRHSPLSHPMALELLTSAEEALSIEISQRGALSGEFYLDALPEIESLKAAIRIFRHGDSLFNIFNSEWRTAKKLFIGISKTKGKCKAAEYELKILSIVKWIEHKTQFNSNEEFKNTFGLLFKGLDTDFSKIRRMNDWYVDSQAELLKYPGFIDNIDLTNLDSRKVIQLGALSPRLQAISSELDNCSNEARRFLGTISEQIDADLQLSGWGEYNKKIFSIVEGFKDITMFLRRFVKSEISPKRAFEVLNAKMELHAAKADFEALNHGVEVIREGVEPLLPGIASVACCRWGEYISQLGGLARASSSLGDFLSEYGDFKSSVRKVHAFIEAKLALDDILVKFAALPERNAIATWEEYYSIVSHRIKSASDLVELLKPVGVTGKTGKEVMIGLDARRNASEIILTLKSDANVMTMLLDLFHGVETDLDSLAATLAWGETIANNYLVRSSLLYPFLINADVSENFGWSKQQLHKIVESFKGVQVKLNELSKFGTFSWEGWNFFQVGQSTLNASALLERIESAASNIQAVLPWSKYNAERVVCKKTGLGDLVICLEQKKLPSESIGSVYEFVIYRSIGRKIYKNFPELEDFTGANHEKKRSEFVSLDREIISLTGKSFAHDIDRAKKVPDGVSSYRASERTEMQLLRNELGKQRRHIPIRQLIRRAGRAIQALKPCFMMGPMSVAQYLQQGAVDFDMIVMDEASQLRPEESLGAIARGKQLIVVGDPKQLPPTNFFDRLVEDGNEDDDSDSPAVFAGSESILDICQQLFHPVRTLRWHYRSQHESLIAFSNYHFYSGKLVVFPSAFDRNNRLGLRYRYIKNGIYKDRQNVPEAQRVVDAVVEHMMKYREESLGVVTLNQTQRDLIEDLLDKKLRNLAEAQTYISEWEEKGWPFFVKNLENVQGDERDIIFISTTFGKAPGTDKPRQNFGPISRPDGWRRLNVLFTRARRKIELFTSMLPEDIVLDSKTPAGTKALKEYLDFAKRGVLTTINLSEREPDSDFELSVGDMLRNQGYEVVPQLGVSGFFIDLAVRNPDRLGEFLAAIECDGASYHSSNSARDRDRIRQAILESLGWKDRIWRIWSTDWFYNPRKESERLLNFLEERRAVSLEEPLDYELEEVFEESTDTAPPLPIDESSESTDPSLSISTEELYVEVGDMVTYCNVDKSDDRHSVMIVDTESNPRLNLINENTPLAQALLNSAIGDEVELVVKGSPDRVMRVLKIQRQEKLFK